MVETTGRLVGLGAEESHPAHNPKSKQGFLLYLLNICVKILPTCKVRGPQGLREFCQICLKAQMPKINL